MESQDKLFYPTYNVLLDLLGCVIQVNDSEIHQLVDYLKNNPSFRGKRNVVVLTDSPNQVVTVELFHLYYQSKHTKLKIASTLHTVLDWVGLPDTHLDFLTDTIKELTAIREIKTTSAVN